MESGSRETSAKSSVGDVRRWLEAWREAGHHLDDERWRRLAALSDEDAWNETLALLALWEPTWTGDAGDELLRHQDVFARARQRSAR